MFRSLVATRATPNILLQFPTTSHFKNQPTTLLRQISDHRDIGKNQELFIFTKHSPGSCTFLPRGALIYNKLISLIKFLYHKFSYQEVITPNLFNKELWETSGHWDLYKENMFRLTIDQAQHGLKPMNCPGHCLIFAYRPRSYRELPLRLAEIGVVHRNESSGALSGLTRVRRFQQDDAHIFCERHQISEEIKKCLEFGEIVYDKLGFRGKYVLSTRPDNYMGSINTWDAAEKQLIQVMTSFGAEFEVKEKEGAFYGPKIDVMIEDSLGKSHQCGTIQLDFNLPERFNLTYLSCKQELERPVIIHRAILGSFERIFAILCETYEGHWPFWISPFQCFVVPVGESADDYAEVVWKKLRDEGFSCDLDLSQTTRFNKKVRHGLKTYNFIAVVGDSEKKEGTVTLRERGNDGTTTIALEDLVTTFHSLNKIN